jgi:hypothetical protein
MQARSNHEPSCSFARTACFELGCDIKNVAGYDTICEVFPILQKMGT